MMAPPSARSGRASAECSDGEGGHSHSAPTSTVGARTLAAVKARAASAQQRLGDLRTTIHGRLAALERQNAEQSAALDAAATERAELHALLLEERAASAATKAARAREQEEMEKKIEKKTSALTAAERDRAELEAALAESLAAHKTHAAIHVEADARQQRLESELIAFRLILKNELRVSDASLGVARAGAEFAERDRQRGEEARAQMASQQALLRKSLAAVRELRAQAQRHVEMEAQRDAQLEMLRGQLLEVRGELQEVSKAGETHDQLRLQQLDDERRASKGAQEELRKAHEQSRCEDSPPPICPPISQAPFLPPSHTPMTGHTSHMSHFAFVLDIDSPDSSLLPFGFRSGSM